MRENHLDKNCGCCEGVEALTPLSTANRPGLEALVYRVGTHSAFLETMIADLSTPGLEVPAAGQGDEKQTIYPLQTLTARQTSDPAIALLDSWAMVADILTFYQERIANEGYLRTAIERRSILELARLVGYKLRPGVAASVYLAYTLDKDHQVTIPAGSRAQSIPRQGELPQPFETAEALSARAEWNRLKPRLTRPQAVAQGEVENMGGLYFQGIATNLKPNDPVLFVYKDNNQQILRRVDSIRVHAVDNRTEAILQTTSPMTQLANLVKKLHSICNRYLMLESFDVDPKRSMTGRVTPILQHLKEVDLETFEEFPTEVLDKAIDHLRKELAIAVKGQYTRFQPWVAGAVEELTMLKEKIPARPESNTPSTASAARMMTSDGNASALLRMAPYLAAVEKPPSLQPANHMQLSRSTADAYAVDSDVTPQLLAALRPALAPILYKAWQKVPLTPETPVQVYTLRTHAAVFGHNGPATESFEINLNFNITGNDNIEQPDIRLTFGIGGDTMKYPADSSFLPINDTHVDIHFIAANERIDFQLSTHTNNQYENRVEMHFHFVHRGIDINILLYSDGRCEVTSRGSNPVTLDKQGGQYPFSDIHISGEVNSQALVKTEASNVVWLDTTYRQIIRGSWVVLERPHPLGEEIPRTVIAQVKEVGEESRADYGLPAVKSTRLVLSRDWLNPKDDRFEVIRGTTVYVQSEPLTLTEAPIDPVAEAICDDKIELDGLYDGLEAGRWLIITGERTDVKPEEAETLPVRSSNGAQAQFNGNTLAREETVPGIRGIPASELVMLAGVEQISDKTLPSAKVHTRLLLANDLAYCYRRDTVTIYGNVAKATHGETRREVLGSGNGSLAFQQFGLRQSPVTYVSAPTPSGIESSLAARVNEVQWHEAHNLTVLKPADRGFVTQTDDDDKTAVIFGNGQFGARLPTGTENIRAEYRSGIGSIGNVAAGQISLLVTRPQGVNGVVNPLAATGGADRDSRDQARHNLPVAVAALDRLVSVQDYADFARTFAGIGKASAVRLTDGRRQVVHLTIAGAGDIPIDKNSDLYRNLGESLRRFGDPYQPIQIDVYQRKLLIITGRVRVQADYLWEAVAPQIRATLLDRFSFDRRQLGQDLLLSEVISAIHSISGVAYVDVDILDAIAEDISLESLIELAKKLKLNSRIVAQLAHVRSKTTDPDDNIQSAQLRPNATDPDDYIQPAQLVYLSPDVPDTLILTEIP